MLIDILAEKRVEFGTGTPEYGTGDPERRTRSFTMSSLLTVRIFIFFLMAFGVLTTASSNSHAQAALLLEEPYGFFGALNPTGHTPSTFSGFAPRHPSSSAAANRADLVR